MKIGRNELCPCGSGQKYKKCCSAKDEAAHAEVVASEAAARAATAAQVAPEEAGEQPPAKPRPTGAQWKTKPKGPLSALTKKLGI
ncbi:MAG: SEC-C metal-binding domain-containing protein [Deltaproteobacteria bacterium]|nr:SEC-C metal-binding domain-containing protein [Deltaproteobacteria bacterium]